MKSTQSATAVLMVHPTSFGFDEQTAVSNTFQRQLSASHKTILARASTEFDAAVATLRAHGIDVIAYDDAPTPAKPSAVFPNNWLSTWRDGSVYLYPMTTESRRVERDENVLDALADNFELKQVTDLSSNEISGKFLESTGVMVFDHVRRIAYGCVSERCNPGLFRAHARQLGYKPHLFYAHDSTGTPIYHTNVMMGVQTSTVVVCLDAITNTAERAKLSIALKSGGRELVEITAAQMAAFCGNVLELRNAQGKRFLAMSQTAYDNFTPNQRRALSRDKTLLPLAIPTIETIGGGSVRCMLAEIFLKPAVPRTGATGRTDDRRHSLGRPY